MLDWVTEWGRSHDKKFGDTLYSTAPAAFCGKGA